MKKTTLALLSISLLSAVAHARDGDDNIRFEASKHQASQQQAVAQNIKVELPNAQERAEFHREKH